MMMKRIKNRVRRRAKALQDKWVRFWLRRGGVTFTGRRAFRMASIFIPPHKAGVPFSMMSPRGYIEPSAEIHHHDLQLGENVYIGERVLLFCAHGQGSIIIGDRCRVFRDTIIDTGRGGRVAIGPETAVHPRCQINAYASEVRIGKGVLIAPNCCFYPHDHGMSRGVAIKEQPVTTKGPITVGDGAWIGAGVVVLGGVSIGRGAVVGAGSVVTRDIPDETLAVGTPARVVRKR